MSQSNTVVLSRTTLIAYSLLPEIDGVVMLFKVCGRLNKLWIKAKCSHSDVELFCTFKNSIF